MIAHPTPLGQISKLIFSTTMAEEGANKQTSAERRVCGKVSTGCFQQQDRFCCVCLQSFGEQNWLLICPKRYVIYWYYWYYVLIVSQALDGIASDVLPRLRTAPTFAFFFLRLLVRAVKHDQISGKKHHPSFTGWQRLIEHGVQFLRNLSPQNGVNFRLFYEFFWGDSTWTGLYKPHPTNQNFWEAKPMCPIPWAGVCYSFTARPISTRKRRTRANFSSLSGVSFL